MDIQNTINLHSKTTTASILTVVVVILLLVDGILPHLPFYDLRAQNSFPVHFFFVLQVLTCILCQLLFLSIIRASLTLNSNLRNLKKDTKITYIGVLVIQLVIIAFLLSVIVQTEVLNEYNSLTVTIPILLSVFLSTCLTGILAFRFIIWLKYGRDRIVFAYAVTMIMITMGSVFLATLILSEMKYNRSIIDSSRIAVSTPNITNFSFKEFQSYVSAASFVSLWVASGTIIKSDKKKMECY